MGKAELLGLRRLDIAWGSFREHAIFIVWVLFPAYNSGGLRFLRWRPRPWQKSLSSTHHNASITTITTINNGDDPGKDTGHRSSKAHQQQH